MLSDDRFPSDENGQVLRHMATQGINLTLPRTIDFEHRFPDEASARQFHAAAQGMVDEARLFPPDPEDEEGDAGWEVQCRQRMVPTHASITRVETRLGALAETFGGQSDGWGTLRNPDGSPAQ